MPNYKTLLFRQKFITPGIADKAALGFLLAAAVATLAPISEALPGFFNTLVAKFFTGPSRHLSPIFEKAG